MRKVKKIAIIMSIILLYTVFVSSLPAYAAFTPKFKLNSEAVYMVNLDTDIVIVSKNADKKVYPASTTKIMTALIALEEIKDFDAIAEVTYDAFNEFNAENPNFYGPSHAAIEPLQTNITYWDLLYSLMVCSACESANILAYNIGGQSIENFVHMMNEKAKEIGCKNTNFTNPHGLFDENNYTTVYDMYLITKYALDNYPGFMTICDTVSYDMPWNDKYPDGYTISTTNQLLKPNSDYYYEGVHGIKTGSIDYYYYKTNGEWDWNNYEYGSRALVTTANRLGSDGRGYNYIIVSMGAPYFQENGEATETQLSFTDHINLYDWVFGEFVYTDVVLKAEQVTQIDVDKGKEADKVGVVAADDFYTLLPRSLDKSTIQQVRHVEKMLEAPVTKGIEVGNLELRLNDETIANIKLVTERDIELDQVAFYKEKIKNLVSTPQFMGMMVVLGVLIVLFVVARVISTNHKKKQRELQKRRKIGMAPQKKGSSPMRISKRR